MKSNESSLNCGEIFALVSNEMINLQRKFILVSSQMFEKEKIIFILFFYKSNFNRKFCNSSFNTFLIFLEILSNINDSLNFQKLKMEEYQ